MGFWWSNLFVLPKDGNRSGRARIVPTRNSTAKKKIRPLPVCLPARYPFKKYPRIFLKSTGTRGYPRGYPIPANILKNIYFINLLIYNYKNKI